MALFNQFLTSINLDPVACGATDTPSMTIENIPADTTIKHRACDECRQRKLACSKDPGGCERCKRENINCYYSKQKPMGRPRKRQFIETTQDDPTHDHSNGIQHPGTISFSTDDFDIDAAIAQPHYTTGEPALISLEDRTDLRTTKTDEGRVVWHFGDREIMAGPPINFGDVEFGSGENIIPPVDPVPRLSTTSNPSLTDSENSPQQNTSSAALAPCSCLASMYLALASLQQIPIDIVSALSTVRRAAATAANSLWCPQCGSVLLDTPTPPIEVFQNTMLLGTILPIIANGYSQLLKKIDAETDEANVLGQTKTFRFHDYGGMCGRQESVQQAMHCVEKELFFNAVEMPPAQWRSTVRALLRVDIYGHEHLGFKRKGLKDLIDEIEYRQRTRHEMMDAKLADGMSEPTNVGHGNFSDAQGRCIGERTRGCLEILRMAKIAIDELVIA